MMKKAALYSRSPKTAAALSPNRADAAGPGEAASQSPHGTNAPASMTAPRPAARRSRLGSAVLRRERLLWAGALVLLVAAGIGLNATRRPVAPPLTLEQIDRAMRKSIDEKPLNAPTSRAYAAVLPSVVRIVGLMNDGDDGSDAAEIKQHGLLERGIGSGVVIVDNGTILTNLHVVAGAKRIRVTFMDGTESDASVVNTQPQNDLAVLRAKTIPDDLAAATMRSTADLRPGDEVMAVGFPFGIGPSASSGVVSGLKRQFRSPEGQQTLTNLIQFDAAANPGNSGGPLVTMDGAVVGIVTAILNPSHQRVFIGIGFAVPIENAASAAGMPPF